MKLFTLQLEVFALYGKNIYIFSYKTIKREKIIILSFEKKLIKMLEISLF
jgi:hypothetical protein